MQKTVELTTQIIERVLVGKEQNQGNSKYFICNKKYTAPCICGKLNACKIQVITL